MHARWEWTPQCTCITNYPLHCGYAEPERTRAQVPTSTRDKIIQHNQSMGTRIYCHSETSTNDCRFELVRTNQLIKDEAEEYCEAELGNKSSALVASQAGSGHGVDERTESVLKS